MRVPVLLAEDRSACAGDPGLDGQELAGRVGCPVRDEDPDGQGTGRIDHLDAGPVRARRCRTMALTAPGSVRARSEIVSRSTSLGVLRCEYLLASEVLHWLVPWRVPVYDSFVRKTLAVPASWDHLEAYRKVTAGIWPWPGP